METNRVRGSLLAVVCTVCIVSACSREAPQSNSAAANAATAAQIAQLQKTDLIKGTGEGISQGQAAVVHYTGWLYDPRAPEQKGTQFDSSRKSGQPFTFVVGAGEVIRGWDEGVQGMQPGGQRRLIIPAHLGYGEAGGGNVIPPNAVLVFDVELLAIREPAAK